MSKTEILLIEDDESDRELILRAFKKNGFDNTINIAKDGVEALEFFKSQDATENLKLILLDLKIPKINGVEVLESIKNNPNTKTIPVIVVTSSQEPRDLFQCYMLGANSYVTKPIDYEDFMKVLNHVIVYWLSINKNIDKKVINA